MKGKILRASNELRFILAALNPLRTAEPAEFGGLNEQKLIVTLKKSKTLTKFTKKLDTQPQFKAKFLAAYPKLSQFITETKLRQQRDLAEFLRISQLLSRQDIHLLLIKSAGEFPHESSNFDCLIKPEKLAACASTLHQEGYEEMLNTREPHKFLFRKTHNLKELPLHIHTRVEWEAAEFADAATLRSRSRPFLNAETGALVPSVEDSMLITVAHYFFEDHEIKLYDLLKLWGLSNERCLDWEYMLGQATRLGWSDALALNVGLLNRMGTCCFGQPLFPEAPKLENSKQADWASKTIKFDSYGSLQIPYGVSALFFLRKVFRNPQISFAQKSQHVDYVLSDILRRRVIGYMEV